MKTFVKIILIVVAFCSLAIFSVRAEAAYSGEYIIRSDGDEYLLFDYSAAPDGEARRFNSLSGAIDAIPKDFGVNIVLITMELRLREGRRPLSIHVYEIITVSIIYGKDGVHHCQKQVYMKQKRKN